MAQANELMGQWGGGHLVSKFKRAALQTQQELLLPSPDLRSKRGVQYQDFHCPAGLPMSTLQHFDTFVLFIHPMCVTMPCVRLPVCVLMLHMGQ